MTADPHDRTLAFYEHHAEQFFDGTVNINMTVLYRPFLEYMPPYAHILDAGCGSGRDTWYFAKRGYRVTAFDYSPSLVKMATRLTGQEVLRRTFQNLDFDNQFDGVWACSSLIHVPMDEMHAVLSRISRAMKTNGILYGSFRYGAGEYDRDGRFFIDMDEAGVDELLKRHPELQILRYWRTSDLRADRADEKWLNLLARKTKPAEG
ncbi:MAG: class I SAM-dependent methyltransferase [Desulfosarcinaceae bacterium]